MRYLETKEETVALLKLVVAAMGQHDAALNPLSFAVFYEHLAGINRRLSQAFDAAMRDTPRLSDAVVQRLYSDFVADVGVNEAQRIQADMQRVMTDIVQSAQRTGAQAGVFGEQLADLSGALDGDATQLAPHLDAAREGTQTLRRSVQDLQDRVATSQREIETLRADLLRTREESMLDPLTRVLNRRGFDHQLDAMLAEAPAKGATHCLIMLDIDHFKRVNDTHGHPVGDKVLQGLGAVLRSVPAEPGMACARYGGEEFAVLLPSTTLNRAVQLAETIRTRTHGLRVRSRTAQGSDLTVTLSAGVAAWHPGEDADELIACADAALYRSKSSGRDRVMVA